MIVYATNSGGTYFAAQKVQEILQKKGYEVALVEAHEVTPETLSEFDLIVFGSNSWNYNNAEGQYHTHFFLLAEKLKNKKYPGKKFAVFALGDASYLQFAGAAQHLEKLVKSIGGTLVVPSLKINRFYADQEEKEQIIADWAVQIT